MAKQKFKDGVNLLPQEEFETTTLGRTLKWLVTTFRYIVICTEIVVMMAFLSRFWLDATSSDLIDQINQKKEIITSYSTFEKEFRSTQDKLQLYATYATYPFKASLILTGIRSAVPSNIILTTIIVDKSTVQITAKTENETAAALFVRNLNTLTVFDNATILSVESKSGEPLSFIISATLKKGTQNEQS